MANSNDPGRCHACGNGQALPKYSVVRDREIISFCSSGCRSSFIRQPAAANAKRGVADPSKPKRKPSARDIARSQRPGEQAISSAAGGYLERAAAYSTRLQSGALELATGHYMKFCTEGTPDRMFADGVICFLEIKNTGEKPSPIQAATIATLQQNGALVFVVDDFGQAEKIHVEMSKRRDRILEIRDAIALLQAEIDAAIKPMPEQSEDAKHYKWKPRISDCVHCGRPYDGKPHTFCSLECQSEYLERVEAIREREGKPKP